MKDMLNLFDSEPRNSLLIYNKQMGFSRIEERRRFILESNCYEILGEKFIEKRRTLEIFQHHLVATAHFCFLFVFFF